MVAARKPPGAPSGARRLFVSLSLAAVIPVLLFAALAMYTIADTARDNARRMAAETMAGVAQRVTSELGKEIEVAETLAALPSLDNPDLPRFYEEARRIAPSRSLWESIALVDLSGLQQLNILRELGEPLGPAPDRAVFERVLRSEKPAIGGIGPIGPVSGRRLVSLAVPVVRQGRMRFVLIIGLSPRGVQEVLNQAGVPDGWIGGIVDGQGNLVARSLGGEEELGRPASQATRDAIARSSSGFYKGRTLENIEVETVFQTLAGPGNWSVHFGIPSAALNNPVSWSIAFLFLAGLASLSLASGLANLVERDMAYRRGEAERRAALALATSEDRWAVAIEAAELGTWRWDIEADEIALSERSCALLDLPRICDVPGENRASLNEFLESVHPVDRAALRQALRRCRGEREAIDVDFRALQRDGSSRWVKFTGRVLLPASLERARTGPMVVHGVVADIHPRKQAEAERANLLRRLAEAQENEQRRIARELHDQVGQTVTGLSLGLKGLEQAMPKNLAGSEAMQDQIRLLQGLAVEIGRDIHRAAADLRPTALDDLGLYRALAAFTADWSARYGVAVDVQAIGLDERLPSEIESAVYRVVQEAMTNILKHAAASAASIVLERRGDELRVVVEDDGQGFEPDAIFQQAGSPELEKARKLQLGLSGIRERLSLLGGSLRLESAPGAGTTLFIQMPLASNGEAP